MSKGDGDEWDDSSGVGGDTEWEEPASAGSDAGEEYQRILPETDGWDEAAKEHPGLRFLHRIFFYGGLAIFIYMLIVISLWAVGVSLELILEGTFSFALYGGFFGFQLFAFIYGLVYLVRRRRFGSKIKHREVFLRIALFLGICVVPTFSLSAYTLDLQTQWKGAVPGVRQVEMGVVSQAGADKKILNWQGDWSTAWDGSDVDWSLFINAGYVGATTLPLWLAAQVFVILALIFKRRLYDRPSSFAAFVVLAIICAWYEFSTLFIFQTAIPFESIDNMFGRVFLSLYPLASLLIYSVFATYLWWMRTWKHVGLGNLVGWPAGFIATVTARIHLAKGYFDTLSNF